MEFDVLIIGGGPAGSAAGLALLQRQGLNIGILEASDYTEARVGESLSPGTRPLLDYLNLWTSFRKGQSLQSFGTQAAWGRPELGSLDFLFTTQGNGWSLDRLAFDRMLAETFRARGGILLLQSRFQSAQRDFDGWWTVRIDSSRQQPGTTIRTRFLMDASGRRGRLGHAGKARCHHDNLVGVARTGILAPGTEIAATVLVEAWEYGWWYTAPLPHGRVVAVLMSDADLISECEASHPERWLGLLGATTHTRARVDKVQNWQRLRSFSANSSLSLELGGAGWVPVGDAAAAHDPLASIGIPYALGSGIQGAIVAADALIAKGQALAAYRQAVRRAYASYLQTRWSMYRREARWPNSRFWQRRRTRLTLDPYKKICASNKLVSTRPATSPFLPTRATRELLESCTREAPVYEVVREIANRHATLSHERIILALQQLVKDGKVLVRGG